MFVILKEIIADDFISNDRKNVFSFKNLVESTHTHVLISIVLHHQRSRVVRTYLPE